MKTTSASSNLFRQLPLDVSIAFATMTVTIAVCMSYAPVMSERAYLTEALLGMSTLARTQVAERIAVEGVLTDPVFAPHAAVAPQDEKTGRRFVYQQSGTSVLATGALRVGKPPVELTFHPAAPAGVPGWSVVWLCGTHSAPPGWVSPAKPQSGNLVAGHLPAVCKN